MNYFQCPSKAAKMHISKIECYFKFGHFFLAFKYVCVHVYIYSMCLSLSVSVCLCLIQGCGRATGTLYL